MNRSVSQVHQSQGTALGTVDPNDPAATAEAVLPYYVDDTKKTRYLSFRATGFTVGESMSLTGVHERTVFRWREADPEFHRLDTEAVGELRRTHAANYQAAEFQRNLRSFMELDRRLIARANAVLAEGGELGDMSREEVSYLKSVRPMYSAQNLAAMVRAANGEKGDQGGQTINFNQLVLDVKKAGSMYDQVMEVANGSRESTQALSGQFEG